MLELISMQVVVFFLILSILVLVHEWGHYIAAKLIGVHVEEFGIGLPPRAKKLFERKGTVFSLNWLPIGGFVRLKGEEAATGASGADAFYEKPIFYRALVLLAGVGMNFVLGVILFAIIYSILGIPTPSDKVRIVEIASNSPAASMGVPLESQIKQFIYDGQSQDINNTAQFIKLIDEHKGQQVELKVVTPDGEEKTVSVIPRENPPENEGSLGVALSNTELKKYPWWEMPFRGVEVGMKEAVSWGREIVMGIWTTISSLLAGKGVSGDVSGPIGIYQISSQVYKFGLLPVLQFMGVLSINLAILNVLPFPALDGGRIAFLGVEKIIGKQLKDRIEGAVNAVGMMILISFMVAITIRDILRLIK